MPGRKKAKPKVKELRAIGLAVPVSSEKRRAKRGKTRESLAPGQSETVPTKHHHPKQESPRKEPGPASGGPGDFPAQMTLPHCRHCDGPVMHPLAVICRTRYNYGRC